MAPTEETAEPTVRQRKNNHPEDEAFKQHNAILYTAGLLSKITQALPQYPSLIYKGGVSADISGLTEWKRYMEGVKAELLEDMSSHLRILLDKAASEAVESYKRENKTVISDINKKPHGPATERKKVFLHRTSLLDDLMEVEHFRTIGNMFVAVLCVCVITTVAVNSIDQGRLVLEFDVLFYTFGQSGTVVWSWICMFLYTLLVPYKVLSFWSSLYPKSKHKLLLSICVGTFLLVSQICILGVFPAYVVLHYRLPPASSFIVLLEQVRFLMKSYSFLRETVPIALKDESKEKYAKIPSPSSYLYFLFCPTLVYRESYPRTPYIRWNYVAKYFAQFVGCVIFLYFIMDTTCFPAFKNMSKQPFSTKTLILSTFHAILPGTFVLLISFYGLLHCWLNAFAEMLRFADRMFYKDWWNSTSYSNYYRTWNVVIHDWLYCYMYQDLLWLFSKRYRTEVTTVVFLFSALVHEYALTLSFGYFYPAMFCLFAIFGVLFNFLINDKWTNPVWNVMFWTMLIIGQGIQLCLYCQEWYARIHCPLTEKTFWDLVTPRSWSCGL